MKRQFFIFLLLLLFALNVSAQKNEVRQIDEFENTNCDDYLGRMDSLLMEVTNFSNSKGYVFVYEGKLKTLVYEKNAKFKGIEYITPRAGIAKGLIGYLKNHLLFRGFDSNRIVFVEAGFREKFTVELWLVPNEMNPPKPTPTLKKIKQRKAKPSPFGFCGEM